MVKELEKLLGYKFKNEYVLHAAMTHSSFGHENNVNDYERLEFLGDSILGSVITAFLFSKFDDFQEGELTQIRSSLVNEKTLSQISKKLKLYEYVRVGVGDKKIGLQSSQSVMADCFEALVGAIYLDGGYFSASEFIQRAFGEVLLEVGPVELDSKSKLQKFIQTKWKTFPTYHLVGTINTGNQAIFEMEVRVRNKPLSRGTGLTKKEAEKNAADNFLSTVKEDKGN